jgi:hypothetical protein
MKLFRARLIDCLDMCLSCRDVQYLVIDYALNEGLACVTSQGLAHCGYLEPLLMYFVRPVWNDEFLLLPSYDKRIGVEFGLSNHFGITICRDVGWSHILDVRVKQEKHGKCTLCGDVTRCAKIIAQVVSARDLNACHKCWTDTDAWMWQSRSCADTYDSLRVPTPCWQRTNIGCKRAHINDQKVACKCGVE